MLVARLEQGHFQPALWVRGRDETALVPITMEAGKGQIAQRICAASVERPNMVNREGHVLPAFVGVAVLAKSAGTFSQLAQSIDPTSPTSCHAAL